MDEQFMEICLSNRAHASERFVTACEEWLRRKPTNRQLLFGESASFDQIAQGVQAFRRASDRDSRLLAAENLADAVVRLLEKRYLSSRTPPADAVEDYYDIGHMERCSQCGRRPWVVQFEVAVLCVHCLVLT